MSRCKVPDCGGTTEYDDDAQAVLCITCGVVTTQEIFSEVDNGFIGNSLYFGPTTLRSLRRIGGVLAGQSSKEDRDRRNTVAMHKYIVGILSRLGYSGFTPRAHSLFDQARVRGGYRWGRKAHLVAGACIAITLRESKKGITMSYLASLMDVSSHSLCRMFTHVNAHFALQVPVLDPITLFPSLQSDLKALLSSPICPLPHAMAEIIQSLPPAPVLRLAISLANIVSCLDGVASSSVPAMACAMLILALEGQAAASFPSYVLLAQELGKKVGASKDLVVGRYREICKVIKEWMEDVPWILGSDHPDNKVGLKRRKMSQRSVIAMGLKDVVEFKEDILRTRNEREIRCPIMVSLDIAQDEEGEGKTEHSHKIEDSVLSKRKRKRSQTTDTSSPSKYLRLTRSRLAKPLTNLDIASLSLLSPSHPLVSDIDLEKRLALVSAADDMRTQILTSAVFPADVPLTRLQSLAVTRGGESHIEDDELFEEGELEGLFRGEDEVVKLRDNMAWTSPDQHTRQHHGQSFQQEPDWAWEDMSTWADLGSNDKEQPPCDTGKRILIESREASPSDWGAEEGDGIDIQGDW